MCASHSSESFATKAINFHKNLHYNGDPLPDGITIMNPFRENQAVMPIIEQFYYKYFDDHHKRNIILGINPGRFGGGLTGIPFTDPKRLQSACGIHYEGHATHEVSSVFVYEMINAYGGPTKFYRDLYINSPCPLGFTKVDEGGREKNYNYYDSPALINAVKPFMIESVARLIQLGIKTDSCFVLGTGKNEKFLNKLNSEHNFFNKMVALEHPRYIMQYKSRFRNQYIEKYLAAFSLIK
jgi:hypothetical protein